MFTVQLEEANRESNPTVGFTGKKIGNPYNVTIEEPIIKTNISSSAKAGSTLNLSAELTNTALNNVKVKPIKDEIARQKAEGNGFCFQPKNNEVHSVLFEPFIEIID